MSNHADKNLHTRGSIVLMILICFSPYPFFKNVIFVHEFVHKFMCEFVCKFVKEFFTNFVHEFKYEICMSSYEFSARKICFVTNGLYCTQECQHPKIPENQFFQLGTVALTWFQSFQDGPTLDSRKARTC